MLIGDDERVVSAVHEASHCCMAFAVGVGIASVTIDNPTFYPTVSGWVRLMSSEFNISVVFSAGKLGQAYFFPEGNHVDNVRDERRLKYLCREKSRREGREFVVEQLKHPMVIAGIKRLAERLVVEGTIEFK